MHLICSSSLTRRRLTHTRQSRTSCLMKRCSRFSRRATRSRVRGGALAASSSRTQKIRRSKNNKMILKMILMMMMMTAQVIRLSTGDQMPKLPTRETITTLRSGPHETYRSNRLAGGQGTNQLRFRITFWKEEAQISGSLREEQLITIKSMAEELTTAPIPFISRLSSSRARINEASMLIRTLRVHHAFSCKTREECDNRMGVSWPGARKPRKSISRAKLLIRIRSWTMKKLSVRMINTKRH